MVALQHIHLLQALSNLQLETDKTSMLESDLQTTSSSLELELGKVAEREEELAVLRNCLQQVIEPCPDQEGEGEGEEREDREVRQVMVDKEAQLRKIEAMLDTTKVSWGGGREGQ